MQHFQAAEFIALKPAKAKAVALDMFERAQLDAMPDWHAVALALHAAFKPKPRQTKDDVAMQDAADAGEFTAWADYQPTGKGSDIARGRVSVVFADGWSVIVGLLAGRTSKGRKPWSVGHAARYAVLCYKLAAARRATGDDAVMYHETTGNAAGISVALDALIAAPEIVSITSADSAETIEGDLIWNPCEANACTRALRAGAVSVPLALAPLPLDIADAVHAARADLVARMGLVYSPMHAMAKAAAARVEALLYGGGSMAGDYAFSDELFALVWDNRDDYPESDSHQAERSARILESLGVELKQEEPAPVDDEPGLFADAPEDVADVPAADHETMHQASEIVGARDADPYTASLAVVSYVERFKLVEDALLAWRALVEPCAFVDGGPVEAEAGRSEDVSAPPAASTSSAHQEKGGQGSSEPVAKPALRVKPRYRVRADGSYELVEG